MNVDEQTGAAPMKNRTAVAIIGGGMAGLSAAWQLQQEGVQYILLEQGDRWGGKVLTEVVDAGVEQPFVVEAGPDSFISQKPWATDLAVEAGLGNELLGTNDQMRQVYVLHKGKPTPLPDGVLLIVPTKFMPFALSPLISPLGKLRMALDLFIPARRDGADETLADFVRRRLGREALDKIAEPLMSGIYNADADMQSLVATFPRFREMEQQYGSLTRGMLASRKARQKGHAAASGQVRTAEDEPARPRTAFISLNEGIGDLVSAVVQGLRGDLRLGAEVASLQKSSGGWAVQMADGAIVEAQAVVLATPAFTSARLLDELAPDAARLLEKIRYVSTGTISLGYPVAAIRRPLSGFGIVIPASERRPINAVTISSIKFDHRAPQGTVLLRAFFGGSRSPQSMDLDDEQLKSVVRRELTSLLGIESRPLFHRVYRWRRSNPQYDVGHLERVAGIEATLPAGLFVTGSAYRGVGLPDVVKQGRDIAKQVAASLLPAL